jgi:hypothetical protein
VGMVAGSGGIGRCRPEEREGMAGEAPPPHTESPGVLPSRPIGPSHRGGMAARAAAARAPVMDDADAAHHHRRDGEEVTAVLLLMRAVARVVTASMRTSRSLKASASGSRTALCC